MPRRSNANAEPLLVLGDGAERMMRMALQPPAELQEEEAAPTDDEGGASPMDVHALANHVAQGGAADPFAFPGAGAGEEGDGEEEEEEEVLQAVEVDGRMAGEEDAAEVEAAEHVVAQGEAADDEAAAQALQEAADTEPEEEAPFERPVVRFVPAARGKGGKKGPKRHRKVLRYVSHPLPALLALSLTPCDPLCLVYPLRSDNIQGVTKGSIRKLARRGGVKRISGLSKLLSLISTPTWSQAF